MRNDGDYAGLADAGVVLDAQSRQVLLHDSRGPVLLEAQFGVRVQVAADAGELVVPAADVFVGFHLGCSRPFDAQAGVDRVVHEVDDEVQQHEHKRDEAQVRGHHRYVREVHRLDEE